MATTPAPSTDLLRLLSGRQRAILALIAQGRSNAEIAAAFGLTLDGAKYHVREILNKLGVDSREEAVAVWNARRHGVPARRWLRALWGVPIAVKAAAGVAILGATGLAAALALAGDGDATPAADETLPTPTVDPAATPADGPIAFRLCRSVEWERPSMAEMAATFAVPRFGLGSGRPVPTLYAYYLAPVIEMYPWANSANIEPAALSGLGVALDSVWADNPRCGSGHLPDGSELFNALWLLDLEPLATRKDGSRVIVTVRDDPGRAHLIYVPDPPPVEPGPPDKGGQQLFREIRVEYEDGRAVFEEGWTWSIAYGPFGAMIYASLYEAYDPMPSFEIQGAPQTFALYTDETAIIRVGQPAAAIRDEAGNDVPIERTDEAPDGWIPLGRVTLAPGRYTLDQPRGAEGQPVEGVHVLMIPVTTPLP
jgi:DNA-binding CsgD family transcriptional regulator